MELPIDSEKYYAATRIIRNKWLPWIKSPLTFVRMVKQEKGMKLYKPIIRKVGNQTRYYIKGETLIDIIDLANKGELEI